MANIRNLKSNSERTPTERKELAKKAGTKSGEARRAKKTMKDMLEYLLEKEISDTRGNKATSLEAIMSSAVKKAITGDIKACEFIRDTLGQKQTKTCSFDGEKGVCIVVGSMKDKKLLEDL